MTLLPGRTDPRTGRRSHFEDLDAVTENRRSTRVQSVSSFGLIDVETRTSGAADPTHPNSALRYTHRSLGPVRARRRRGRRSGRRGRRATNRASIGSRPGFARSRRASRAVTRARRPPSGGPHGIASRVNADDAGRTLRHSTRYWDRSSTGRRWTDRSTVGDETERAPSVVPAFAPRPRRRLPDEPVSSTTRPSARASSSERPRSVTPRRGRHPTGSGSSPGGRQPTIAGTRRR